MSNTDIRTSIEEAIDKWIEDYGVELDTEAEHALRYGVTPQVEEVAREAYERGLADGATRKLRGQR